MRLAFALCLFASFGSLALAQQKSPVEQALGQRVLSEISANVEAQAAIIDLQRQLAAAQAKIKELEAKVPKADPPK